MPVARVVHQSTWLLGRANARAQSLLVAAFARHDLRPLHYRTLAALHEHGEMSQADLGRHLDLDRKDVAVTLDQLAERELVERRPDPADGRRNVVALTTAGRRAMPRLDRTLAKVQEEVLAPLTERERRTLLGLLDRLQ